MNWIKQSISGKLAALLVATLATIMLFVGNYHFKVSGVIDGFDSLLTQQVQHEREIKGMLTDFKTQVQEWKNVLLRGHDQSQLDKYWGRFQQREQEIQAKGNELLSQLEEGEAKQNLQSFLSSHKRMGEAYRKGKKAFVDAGADPKVGDAAVKGIDREPAKTLDQATKNIAESAQAIVGEMAENAALVEKTTVGLLLLVIIVAGVVFMMVVQKTIIAPSVKVNAILRHIAEGKIDNHINSDGRVDEIGQLVNSADAIQKFLQDLSGQMGDATNQLFDASQNLNRCSADVASAVDNTHQRVDQVAAAMHEMSATSEEVAGHAVSAAEITSSASGNISDSVKAMGKAHKAIDTLARQIEDTMTTVNKLAEDTNNVGTVLNVIRGIAEQTNLLALNAAIEAARAGEQGRGFAVVADEVRSLAQKTQDSTAEIESIIESVQSGAKNTVSVMHTSQETTKVSEESFNLASGKLDALSDVVDQISQLNTQVSTAAEEQTSVTADISRNLTEVVEYSSRTGEIVRSTSEAAATLDALAKTTQLIRDRLR